MRVAVVAAALLPVACGGEVPFAEPPAAAPSPRGGAAGAVPAGTAEGGAPASPAPGAAAPSGAASRAPTAAVPAGTTSGPSTAAVPDAAAQASREAIRTAYAAYWEAYAEALLARDIRIVEPHVTAEELGVIGEELRGLAGRHLAALVRVAPDIEEISLAPEGRAVVTALLRDTTVAVLPGSGDAAAAARAGEQWRSVTELEREQGRWLVAGSAPRVHAPALTLETRAAEMGVSFSEAVRAELTSTWRLLLADFLSYLEARRQALLLQEAGVAERWLTGEARDAFAEELAVAGGAVVELTTHHVTAVGESRLFTLPIFYRWLEAMVTDYSYPRAAVARGSPPEVYRVRIVFHELGDPDGRFQVERIEPLEE